MKYIIVLFAMLSSPLLAQEAVYHFTNPSFEGALNGCCPSLPPSGWNFCANSPDIFPSPPPTDPCLAIPAYDGNACIEMIAGNHPSTPEAIGQRLNVVLEQDSAYYFEIFIKTLPLSCGTTGQDRLEIYLGQDSCQQSQLAYTSPNLDSIWHSYIVPFIPTQPSTYIRFQPALQLPQFPFGSYVTTAQIDMLSPIYKGVYTSAGTVVRGREVLKVFPNPAKDNVSLNFPEQEQDTDLLVYSIDGVLIERLSLPAHSQQLDYSVGHLSNGIYVLKSVIHEGLVKLIIMH